MSARNFNDLTETATRPWMAGFNDAFDVVYFEKVAVEPEAGKHVGIETIAAQAFNNGTASHEYVDCVRYVDGVFAAAEALVQMATREASDV